MLFERETYLKIQPHQKVKHHKVEDILIARMYKEQGLKMQCLTGNETITCRMYSNSPEAINGFAKNVAEFFGGSHFAALLYWMIGTFGIFVIAAFLPVHLFLIGLGLITGTKILISVSSKQNIFENLLFAVPQQINLGRMILLSYQNKKLKQYKWKGRNIG